MSKCTRWVDEGVIGCKAWADQQSASCSTWADMGSNQCSQWADEGSSQCTQWADKGSSQCCTWWPCSWACSAFYWVAKWVCLGWYWVAKWVCKAWYWVANLVCQVWVFVVKAVCTVWGWIAKLVCVASGIASCAFNRITSLFRRPKRAPRIKKVFVLMLENRSFDHMLGFADLSGTDAIDGSPTRADNIFGLDPTVPPFTNSYGGAIVGVTPDALFKILETDSNHLEDPGHEFRDVLMQLGFSGVGAPSWNDGSTTNAYPPITNRGYIASHSSHFESSVGTYARGALMPEVVMKCLSPASVPVITKLAQEFAVCDRWFSSMPGPTWPNRFFLHCASSGGLDDSPSGLETTVASLLDGYRFSKGSLFDRLDENCRDWRIFEGDEFPQSFAISGMDLNALEGRFADFEEFAREVADASFAPSYVFIEPSYGNILPTTAGDFTCGTSQHPLDDITRGERLIKQVYEAIRSSPHWETSALLITYDEHGGFFDHVVPPGAGSGLPVTSPGDVISNSASNRHNFQFDQLGVRVPAIVISPLIPRGTVDHTVYDHSSVSRTLGRLFGMKSLTMRDAAANDFLHLFSLSKARGDTPVTLPEPADSMLTCTPGFLTGLTDASDEPDHVGGDDTSSSHSSLVGAPTRDERGGGDRLHAGRSREVPSSFWGFMRVALRKAILATPHYPLQKRQAIVEQFLKVRTERDARRFIHECRVRIRRHKNPIDDWHPPVMQRKRTPPTDASAP